MIETISKISLVKLKALGIYQIVFGILGVAFTAWLFEVRLYSPGWMQFLYFVPFGLYAYSIYIGTRLFKEDFSALKYALINQYLQLIQFSIVGFGFSYLVGPFVSPGISLTNGFAITWGMGIMPAWNLQIANHSGDVIINCNVIALGLIIVIYKLQKKLLPQGKMQPLTIGAE